MDYREYELERSKIARLVFLTRLLMAQGKTYAEAVALAEQILGAPKPGD